MADPPDASVVLTLRVPRDVARRLAREARRQRRTRSAVARDILTLGLSDVTTDDRASEARRQSRLVSRRDSERDTLRFIIDAADLRGWS